MAASFNHPAPGTILQRPTPSDPSSRFDNSSHRLPWEKFNRVSVWLYPGTQIVAPDVGTISPDNRSYGHGGTIAALRGLHCYLVSHTAPFVYYFGGLRALTAPKGRVVNAGETIGYSGILGGTPHLHFALPPGYNPQDFVKHACRLGAPKGGRKTRPGGGGVAGVTVGGPDGWGPDSTSGDNASLPDAIENAWHALEFALRVTLPTSSEAVKSAARDVHKAVY